VRCGALPPAMSDPMVGILIRTRIGMDVYGTNTGIEHAALGDFETGDRTRSGLPPGVLAHAANLYLDGGDPNADAPATTGWTMPLLSTWWTPRECRRSQPRPKWNGASHGKGPPACQDVRASTALRRCWKRISGAPWTGKPTRSASILRGTGQVPRSRIRIVLGATSRTKVIEIEGFRKTN